MGDSPSVDGGLDDPDRVWRRPAPGDPPAPPTESTWTTGAPADDPERAIWGPEADPGARPGPAAPPAPPPTWVPTAAAAAGPTGPPAPPERRWEPTVEATPDTGAWAARPDPADVGVDERPARPPRQPIGEQFGGWWARAGIAAAVLALVIAVVAVASGSDPGGDAATATSAARTTTTSAPRTTTTAPGTTTEAPTTSGAASGDVDPADLAPGDDPRVMLTPLPDGYEAVHAQLMLDNTMGGRLPGLLFVADGSTWYEGPWVMVSSTRDASFVGPAAPIDLGGGRAGRIGTSESGAELVAADLEGEAVAVSAKGLPEGTASAIASGLVGGGGSWTLPASVLPAGLEPAGGDLADSMSMRATSSAIVNYRGPGGVGVTVFATLADPGYDPLTVAPFYLSDVAYVTIDGEPGVVGNSGSPSGSAIAVEWRHSGVDVQMTAWGMDRNELLALAANASTRIDGGWNERTWQDAAEGSRSVASSEPARIGDLLDFGDEVDGTALAQRSGSSVSWWIDGPRDFSIGRYGQEAGPVVLQVASNPYPANGTGNVSYVVALALGDASIDGATLRVRTGASVTGGEGNGGNSGAIVHAIEPAGDDAAGAPSELGYTLGATVAVPWTEGDFVAELIAADGVTILATATRADLL